MLKKLSISAICLITLQANDITLSYGKKDFDNSKTKIDGYTKTISISTKYKNSQFNMNYLQDDVDRKNFITNQSLKTLHVKKYNFNYKQNLNKNLLLKANYIKIDDNLAPTDNGDVYGLGVNYRFNKSFGASISAYKSDYETFNVNQYDISLYKSFKIANMKSKLEIIAKSIKIDGDKYGNYTFKEKDYFTTAVKFNTIYNGYIFGVASFFGERAFSVLNDGSRVQHQAMRQDETYIFKLGKKFKNFDVIASYSYQKGKELPENQENVKTKTTSLNLKYKF